MDWIHVGERNTHFYHVSTITSCHFNHIDTLQDAHGTCIEGKYEVQAMVRNFLFNLYSDDNGLYQQYILLGNRFSILNKEDIQSLNKPFTCQEIKKDLFDIRPLTAPSPDSFHALSLSALLGHYWEQPDAFGP